VGSNVHEQLKNVHTNSIQKGPQERSSGLSHLKMCGVVSCTTRNERKKGACHTVALPFKLKTYLKAKEELWKLKYILPCKKYNVQKIL
jgi:hypothetical protein